MLSVIRHDVDFAFRFGGDEFAMIVFASYPYACEKSRQVLGMMDGKVSIGISSLDEQSPDNLTLEAFILRADQALYEAKNRGRGRVVVDFCPLPDSCECAFPCPNLNVACHD